MHRVASHPQNRRIEINESKLGLLNDFDGSNLKRTSLGYNPYALKITIKIG